MRPFQLPRWKFTHCCGPQCADHARGAEHAAHSSAGHGTDGSETAGQEAGGAGRRDFFRTAALAAAGVAALAGGRGEAQAQVRVFPPAPPKTSPIEGLIDFHAHTAPDVFGRSIDDQQLATLLEDRQMEAVVLKSHTALTADRAYLARKIAPKLKVFGGVALNGPAGGLNAEAVQWMWRMQGGYGRVVWLPTFDADHHVKHFKDAPEGIKVVDGKGQVLPALREVLKVCAEQKLVVCTGHASPEECLAIIAAARDAGCDRILVTHCQFEVVNMTEAQMKKAASMGAKLELDTLGMLMGPDAHLGWMKHWRNVSTKETAERIKAVGAKHFVLGTDLGQTGNPSPADGMAMLVGGLLKEGISKDDIRTMGREVPGALLMG